LNRLVRLALYQPDIAPNTGTILRLAAAMNVAVDLIEPAGFVFSDRRLRRAGLDYLDSVDLVRHRSWEDYTAARLAEPAARLVLLTTGASQTYTDFAFRADDTLMVGRETAGVPEEVHANADARVLIPMAPGMRSLNVALATAMVLGEALRQTDLFPRGHHVD
jgi:tRNA (cytidine/uridine-2'-O-)-methyltransferase